MSVDDTQNGGGAPSPRSFAIAHQRPRTSFVGCSRIADYEILGKLGEGTFGEVHRARSRKTGALYALKKIIMHNEKDGFPITALREIKLLKLLSHKNVLRLEDMAVEHPAPTLGGKRKRPIMYMVTPYMDHDLSGLLDNPSVHFTEPQIKCYMLQLLEGLKYLHENKILHRDMKAANLLINNKGILQIADFGLARHYEGDTPKPGRGAGDATRDYTSLVVTRWYRPPELLMHLKRYTTAIDMWGVGCVFGEMLVGKPILTGESDTHQLELIFDLCGTPTEENMPGWRSLPGGASLTPLSRPGNLSHRFRQHGPLAISLLKELLKLNWKTRINAFDALQHSYFKTAPLPAAPGDIPKFEESHEFDRRKFQDRKAALPPAPKGGTVGRGGMDPNSGPNAGYNNGDYSGRNGINGGGRYPPRRGPPVEERVPAWQHRDRGLPHAAGLPPRPPPPAEYNGGWDGSAGDHPERFPDRERSSRPPRGVGGGSRPDVDTYIPSYDRDAAPPRRDDRDVPPRRDDRDVPPRRDDRDVPPRRDDWRRREDRDDRRHDWRRAPEYDDRGRTSRTRSRSRSPIRDRERDRDAYRR
ncbi:kinase-like domain-containing protein [Rhypophila decipiens]|uniref:Serine/threonine-protein kinase BUR1 n=1 Tax=Rhypophila decipiens TaxID=261697 RepID=A0AAN6YHV4_9PEZI|nr:kinase-like domain-containing protein [Rhypophila decipiens]